MPTLELGMRQSLAEAAGNEFDAGTGTARFVLETSADAEVAGFDLQDPAFGTADANAIVEANGLPLEDTDANGGDIDHAAGYDQDGTKLLEATAGTSDAEVIVSSISVGAGETVTLTELTMQMPAS